MLPITGFLLSMQAAGMVASMWDINNKQKLIDQGRQLEQAALSSNLEALNYEYQESSLASMKQLRQNLGSQIALNAAKGGGSSEAMASATQKSISNQSTDERTRRMNLLSKEANLRAQNVLSGLHTLQSETQLGRESMGVLSSLPASSAFDQFRRSDFGEKWGFGYEAGTPKRGGFGLESV